MSIKIWHNPRCSKSRATLQLLQENGVEPEVVLYLENTPSTEELDGVLTALGKEPRDMMRKREAPYSENNLSNDGLSRSALIDAMVANPILIERPVVINGSKAAVGRPPESVLDIIQPLYAFMLETGIEFQQDEAGSAGKMQTTGDGSLLFAKSE